MAAAAARQAMPQVQTDTLRRDPADTIAPIRAAGPVAESKTTLPSLPLDVQGYHITDSAHFSGDKVLTEYTYTRNEHDDIHVFVAPYRSDSALRTKDDTVALIEGYVDVLRQTLDDAFRRGDLSAFRTLRERSDDLKTGGHTVHGYVLVAGLTHRGGVTSPQFEAPPCSARQMASQVTSGLCMRAAETRGFQAYEYYGVYALTDVVVRIRTEMPRQTAVNEEASDFSRKLVAALVATTH
jgi:hypothetical protein